MITRWQEFDIKALENLNDSLPISKVSRSLEFRVRVCGVFLPSKFGDVLLDLSTNSVSQFISRNRNLSSSVQLIIYRQHCPTILRLWISPRGVQRPMRYLVNSLRLLQRSNPWTPCGHKSLSILASLGPLVSFKKSHLFSRRNPLQYPLHCVKGDSSRVGAVLSKFRRASEFETAWRMISTH